MTPAEEDDLEQMRPIVERLEVQATALLDKGRRPEIDTSDQTAPLPPIEFVFSLDHAHNTLHTALNSVMRFMQGFHPTAPRDHIAVTMAEKYLRYAPWFAKWEAAFTTYLADQREQMTNMDLKRAMVLKANHLVGTMLSCVDQSAGPVAYDAYEAEFRAIVDLSREVLASFSCPPLPTLTGGSSGTPYYHFRSGLQIRFGWRYLDVATQPFVKQPSFAIAEPTSRRYLARWPAIIEQQIHAPSGSWAKRNKRERRVKGRHPPDANKRKRISAVKEVNRNGQIKE